MQFWRRKIRKLYFYQNFLKKLSPPEGPPPSHVSNILLTNTVYLGDGWLGWLEIGGVSWRGVVKLTEMGGKVGGDG